jgi:hypothetical protein
MMDWDTDSLIPLAKAPLPGHVATKWRWAMKGVRGVKLESIVVGGQRFTTADACRRFVANLNGEKPTESTTSATERAIEAGRKLRAMGA